MATTLDEFDFNKNMRGRSQMHPWDEWTDGRIWKITQGIDFSSQINSMRSYLSQKGKVYGKKVRTTQEGKSLIFQFFEAKSVDEQGA